jgi:hypothetical protein
MILTPEDIEAVAVRVAELVKAPSQPREVMNAREAAEFVGKPSVEAFYLWRKKHQVRACGHGRYTLTALQAAMEREGRKTYQHLAPSEVRLEKAAKDLNRVRRELKAAQAVAKVA